MIGVDTLIWRLYLKKKSMVETHVGFLLADLFM